MAVKNYLINDKWLDIDKQNIVEVKSTDGVIGSVKLNGEEYGGGGGSSDFSTARVTIATTMRLGANYSLNCFPPNGNNFISAIINADGSLTTDSSDNTVTVNAPDTYNILFTQNGYIEVYTPTPDNIVAEGNGEVLTESIEGEETTFVRVYGDCTITIS